MGEEGRWEGEREGERGDGGEGYYLLPPVVPRHHQLSLVNTCRHPLLSVVTR